MKKWVCRAIALAGICIAVSGTAGWNFKWGTIAFGAAIAVIALFIGEN